MTEPAIGSTASIELVVAASDLASELSADPVDDFPPVFATSRMVAIMELAAARLLMPCLGPGELSVGVTVDIAHTAATPLGGAVRATARFTAREGKLFVFEVAAADGGGEIGRGVHKRAIISRERLMSGAARRNPSA